MIGNVDCAGFYGKILNPKNILSHCFDLPELWESDNAYAVRYSNIDHRVRPVEISQSLPKSWNSRHSRGVQVGDDFYKIFSENLSVWKVTNAAVLQDKVPTSIEKIDTAEVNASREGFALSNYRDQYLYLTGGSCYKKSLLRGEN